jgi:hypothetical protein
MSKPHRKSAPSSRSRHKSGNNTYPPVQDGWTHHRRDNALTRSLFADAMYVTVVAMPSFLDDAYDLLTPQQLDELPRRIVRERGQVYYQHAYITFRSLVVGPSRVWILDRWDLGEIWLIGLQPNDEGDEHKPPTAKVMAAIRRVLGRFTPVAVYELLKMLRDWLQLNDVRMLQLALLVAAGMAQSEDPFEQASFVINPPDDIFVLGVLSTKRDAVASDKFSASVVFTCSVGHLGLKRTVCKSDVTEKRNADLDTFAIEQDLSVIDDAPSITAKDCSRRRSARHGSTWIA